MKKYLAEMVGTMVLVLMGCGSAVMAGGAAAACGAGVGTLGVALAFGLSVVASELTEISFQSRSVHLWVRAKKMKPKK